MKTIKFLLVALLLMVCGTIAHAQSVVVYKTDGTKVEYNASDVKEVKYKNVYYYYAGWNCPTDLTTLAQLAVAPNGGIVDMTQTYSKANPIRDLYYTENAINSGTSTKAQYYIVVPNGHSIYDDDGDITSSVFDKVTEVAIPNHTIWKSAAATNTIKGKYIY